MRVLARRVGVTDRTIFPDLQIITDLGVPHMYDSEAGGYRIRRDFFRARPRLAVPIGSSASCNRVYSMRQVAALAVLERTISCGATRRHINWDWRLA